MASHETNTAKSDDWQTPQWIIDAFPNPFDFDPCASEFQITRTATIMNYYPSNGLLIEWKGIVWLNPPFSKGAMTPWLEKMIHHNNGILLIPARTDTIWFHQFVFGCARSIFFFWRRPQFVSAIDARNGINSKLCGAFPVALASYGDAGKSMLECATTKMKGSLIDLPTKVQTYPLFD